MKYRLDSGLLTEEDYSILAHLCDRSGTKLYWAWCRIVGDSDERDADLMLEAQHVAEWGPAAIELHGIACRGWNDRGYYRERVWMR
jgi:hypothetical protein